MSQQIPIFLIHSIFAFLTLFLSSCGGDHVSKNIENNASKNEQPAKAKAVDSNISEVVNNENISPEKEFTSPSIERIQNILGRANPDYRGQGKFHEESGVIVADELANGGLRYLSPL